MASFDMKSDFNFTRAANLTVGNNTQNSALIDTQGWEGLTVVVHTATVTASGADITFKLQHSDTTAAADFVDCTAAEVIGAADPVDDNGDDNMIKGTIGYRGNKRYVRLVAVGSASANAVVFAEYVRSRSGTTRPVPAVGATTAAT
jgi:hypothetical protein